MKMSDGERVAEWEVGLLAADDLIPLSLSHLLVPPHLATAFNLPTPENSAESVDRELEEPHGHGCSTATEKRMKGSRRARVVWGPQLHRRFVEAVGELGVETAGPKSIMRVMNVEGLTRENVASHLQKYRLFLRRRVEGPVAPMGVPYPCGYDYGYAASLG